MFMLFIKTLKQLQSSFKFDLVKDVAHFFVCFAKLPVIKKWSLPLIGGFFAWFEMHGELITLIIIVLSIVMHLRKKSD